MPRRIRMQGGSRLDWQEKKLARIALNKPQEALISREEVSRAKETRAYRLLCEIQKVLQDETLQDSECFWRIEQLVCLFEENGLDAGIRHDFG